MALTIDIRANDEMERSANAAADALDEVASREEQIDATSKDIARSWDDAAAGAMKLSKSTALFSQELQRDQKVAQKLEESGSRDQTKTTQAAGKQQTQQSKKIAKEKQYQRVLKDIVKATVVVSAAIAAAAASTVALGVALASAAKSAFETRREGAAMVAAFSGKHGQSNLRILDELARNLGESIDVVRAKFVEYRKANFNPRQAASLIKMRADIIAVTGSAERADEALRDVTSAADGMTNADAMRRLAIIGKAFGVLGDGAAAGAKAGHSWESAMNELSDTTTKALADVWKEIGPAIGEAANRLSKFVSKFIESKDGRAAIEGIGKAFREVAAAINDATLDKMLEVFKVGARFAEFLAKSVWAIGHMNISGLGETFEDALRPLGEMIDEKLSPTDRGNKIQGPRRAKPGGNTIFQSYSPDGGGGVGSITIERLIVNGGDPQANARAIRQELQLLLQAGALSRGYA